MDNKTKNAPSIRSNTENNDYKSKRIWLIVVMILVLVYSVFRYVNTFNTGNIQERLNNLDLVLSQLYNVVIMVWTVSITNDDGKGILRFKQRISILTYLILAQLTILVSYNIFIGYLSSSLMLKYTVTVLFIVYFYIIINSAKSGSEDQKE